MKKPPMDKNMEREILDIFWKNTRISLVRRKDLINFIKIYFEPKLKKDTRKEELIEKAKQYLTEDTLQLFSDNIDGFGLLKKDISEIFSVTTNTITKWERESLIKQNGERRLSIHKVQDIKIYSIPSILNSFYEGKLSKKKKQDLLVPPQTDENIAQALYVINKSAKVSRDTKNVSYLNRRHDVCKRSKTRMLNLYYLKDAVIKQLLSDGKMEYLGINKQIISEDVIQYLKLYRIAGFTFHVPCDCIDKDDPEIFLSDIDGAISAEKSREVSLTYTQAVRLLEDYSGVKATGTYNDYYY